MGGPWGSCCTEEVGEGTNWAVTWLWLCPVNLLEVSHLPPIRVTTGTLVPPEMEEVRSGGKDSELFKSWSLPADVAREGQGQGPRFLPWINDPGVGNRAEQKILLEDEERRD